jgi:hypothetical protein
MLTHGHEFVIATQGPLVGPLFVFQLVFSRMDSDNISLKLDENSQIFQTR